MAASKRYLPTASYRFFSGDEDIPVSSDSVFELDESDVWNSDHSASPEFRTSPVSSRISRKKSVVKSNLYGAGVTAMAAASLPVNVPDWSKILKEEYRENRRRCGADEDDFDEDGWENRIPPHEFLAEQLARTRIASFSVYEGIGRTLKGRDLSRVRNAIFEKTGFQD
ncbi:hypothetical protein HAX54_010151 [Datura stramonium]|uniref:Senescence regulator n=1 Tax=Datura stramonium TaxID=4076 RepID=A0ABS8TH92_DATST|nr:hypothetical protein [Datura stramonium]